VLFRSLLVAFDASSSVPPDAATAAMHAAIGGPSRIHAGGKKSESHTPIVTTRTIRPAHACCSGRRCRRERTTRSASASRSARNRHSLLHSRLRQWPVPGTQAQSCAQRTASGSAISSARRGGTGAGSASNSDGIGSTKGSWPRKGGVYSHERDHCLGAILAGRIRKSRPSRDLVTDIHRVEKCAAVSLPAPYTGYENMWAI